jgi:hypothetical protein
MPEKDDDPSRDDEAGETKDEEGPEVPLEDPADEAAEGETHGQTGPPNPPGGGGIPS